LQTRASKGLIWKSGDSVLSVLFANLSLCAAHCRGGATSFVLKQKKQKFKTEKTFYPQGQLPARFSVWPLPALNRSPARMTKGSTTH